MIQIPGFSLSYSFQKVTGTLGHFKPVWIRLKKRRHQARKGTCQVRWRFRSTCLKSCWCKPPFIVYKSYLQPSQRGFPHPYHGTLKP